MNILILGSGGREHTFAWKIVQSDHCERLYVAPGNAGTATIAENVDLDPNDFPKIGEWVLEHNIDLVLVGPEEPLVKGIKDYFVKHAALKDIPLVGPSQQGAQLEGSKHFAKEFMEKYGIPTARSATFSAKQIDQGLAYLGTHALPVVLKADGLAAGKGVIICQTFEHAAEALTEMLLQEKFGEASRQVVIEEYLEGIELSVFVLTDGNSYLLLPEAKDYKRIGARDTGPNTGGMGAVSPVSFASEAFMTKVRDQIIIPTIAGIKQEQMDYCGFVFIGLMNVAGDPYVIEYNVRMGDPETQVVLPRIKSDLVPLLLACTNHSLENHQLEIDKGYASTVVLVSGGYPEAYQKGKTITGIDQITSCLVFHAGTKFEGDQLLTNGGRVIALTGKGSDLPEALSHCYQGAKKISWENMYLRNDIGQDLLANT